MPCAVTMPKFGMTMTEGTIVEWLVAEGDRVEENQLIAEIETEKIVNELTAPASGKLVRISLPAGESAAVQAKIAWILQDGETVDDIPELPAGGAGAEPAVATSTAVASTTAPPAVDRPRSSTRGAPSSPSARRLARELGVDLSTVQGTGPGGRISREDVQRTAPQTAAPTAAVQVEPLSPMRKAIVSRVTTSAAIPSVTLYTCADATGLRAVRQDNQDISIGDAILFCTARALRNHKYLNAAFVQEGIQFNEEINIGFAAAVDHGLVIPVIRRADRRSLVDIAGERKRLVEKARSRRITKEETSGGTFTITNLGGFPVDRFNALINPPQAAILSVGRIREQPVAIEGMLAIRPMFEVGLTLDHRVLDGAAGAAFLQDWIHQIESLKPEAS